MGFAAIAVQVEVSSSRTREGLPDVQVGVFADGAEEELQVPTSVPTRTVTGADGRLTRSLWFSTYSGTTFWGADHCNRKLRSLEIVLPHPDYGAKRVTVEPVKVSSPSGGDVSTIVVPQIFMDPLR